MIDHISLPIRGL